MDRLGLRSRRGAAAAVVFALALVAAPSSLGEAVPSARSADELPNFIVITTDDQPTTLFGPRFMPATFADLAIHEDTARFSRALALPPVCCPYRASFLTGQYPHNNGVFSNRPGYPMLRDKENVLPAWLQRLGYHTAVAGKYLNGTSEALADAGLAQAPGWDEWFVRAGESNSYFDVEFTDRRAGGPVDGLLEPPESAYFTDLITERAIRFLEKRAEANAEGARQPFFLWIPHLAPHIGDDIGRGDQNGCSRRRFPSVTNELLEWAQLGFNPTEEVLSIPGFGEPDIADKPSRTKKHKRFDEEKIALIAEGFLCAAAAVHGIDLSNAAIWEKLGELDMRRETIVVFTTDNGFFYGEHRYALKKGVSYEPALRIPLLIHVPPAYNESGASPPERVGEITGQIDLAPTILDYAEAPTGSCLTATECRTMDGRSLRAILGDFPQAEIARLGEESFRGRGMLVERVKPCFWPALRTPRIYYSIDPADPGSDEPDCGPIRGREIYDLKRDPIQDHNLIARRHNLARRRMWTTRIQSRFLPQLLRLRSCRGVEGRDPELRHYTFCE